MKQDHIPLNHCASEDICSRCGAHINWDGEKYVELGAEHNDDFDFIDIFWACVIAGILAFVSAARHW